jgi:hypothetical protein
LDGDKLMAVKRIEALADAFAHMLGALDPLSEAYKLRNPLLIRAFNPKHARNEKGHRIFKTFIAGYENSLLSLRLHCQGKLRSHIGPETPVVELLHLYGHPTTALKSFIRFLRHALEDDNLPSDVKLGWFLIEPEEVKDEHHAAGPA